MLFVLLIIVIALLVRHAILRTGGAFDEDGNYIAIEDDSITPQSIFKKMPNLRMSIETEIKRIEDLTNKAVQNENFWRSVTYFNTMDSTSILKIIKSIESAKDSKYSHLILLLYTYANFIRFIKWINYDWSNLHLSITDKFKYEHVLVGQNKIDIYDLKPEQLTQEICDDIVEKARALPPNLTRYYVGPEFDDYGDSDYYDNVDRETYINYHNYEEEDLTIPVDELQERLQKIYNDINDRKWALMMRDCIN